jgi:hypothetical protein
MSNTLNQVVRDQILAGGPEILDGESELQEQYIDSELNAMTNVELLSRISDALHTFINPNKQSWL